MEWNDIMKKTKILLIANWGQKPNLTSEKHENTKKHFMLFKELTVTIM